MGAGQGQAGVSRSEGKRPPSRVPFTRSCCPLLSAGWPQTQDLGHNPETSECAPDTPPAAWCRPALAKGHTHLSVCPRLFPHLPPFQTQESMKLQKRNLVNSRLGVGESGSLPLSVQLGHFRDPDVRGDLSTVTPSMCRPLPPVVLLLLSKSESRWRGS